MRFVKRRNTEPFIQALRGMLQPKSLKSFHKEVSGISLFSDISLFPDIMFLSFKHLMFDPLGPASANSLPILQPLPNQIPGIEAGVAVISLCRLNPACTQYLIQPNMEPKGCMLRKHKKSSTTHSRHCRGRNKDNFLSHFWLIV